MSEREDASPTVLEERRTLPRKRPPPRSVRIRSARTSDIADVARIYRFALAGADLSDFPWWEEEVVRLHWKAPNSILGVDVFVLEHGRGPVGVMTIGELDGDLEVDSLVIHPRHQRRGHGRRCVRFAEGLAARRGYRRVVVEELISREGVPSPDYQYWFGLGYRPILGPRITRFSRKRGALEVRLAKDVKPTGRGGPRSRPKSHR